ncbi:MAG: hypothetical protein WC254_01970 [Candidatus Woesearchaeota archaeon]|jgi:hypothetical protein
MKVHANERTLSFSLFFIFLILLLSIIPTYRYIYHAAWPSEENSYYHIRMAEYVLTNGIPFTDPAVISQTLYFFDPFDILLGLFSTIIGTHLASLFLPFILGIITLYFLYTLISSLFSSSKTSLISGIFLITCPLVLTLFSQATELGFIACLFSIGIYIILKTEKPILAYIPFILLSFYDIFHSIIIIGFLICFCYHKKKHVLVLTGIITGISIVLFFYRHESMHVQIPMLLPIIQQLLSDLGGNYGFSIFAIFLTILGISTDYFARKHVGLIILIIGFSMFISPIYLLYLIPYITISSTRGFFSLLQREWKLQYLQNIVLFLLVLGIIFSTTSTISRIATRGPSPEIIQGLTWLEENSFDNSIIFTDKQQGFIVEYITHRRVMFDKNTPLESIPNDVYSLLLTKNTEEALIILEKYQIDYIILFSETPHPSLLLVLKSTENFKKVFENNDISIWSVYY